MRLAKHRPGRPASTIALAREDIELRPDMLAAAGFVRLHAAAFGPAEPPAAPLPLPSSRPTDPPALTVVAIEPADSGPTPALADAPPLAPLVVEEPAVAALPELFGAVDAGTATLVLDGRGSSADAGGGAAVTVTIGAAGPTSVVVDQSGVPAAGDGQADSLVLGATAAADAVQVTGSGTGYTVTGLSAPVTVAGSEGALDSLAINGLGGNDSLAATPLTAGVVQLTLDGGDGDDVLSGSQAADVLIGGAGADIVTGDNGNDLALLGSGDDGFQWSPGDGNDTVEGQAGTDRLLFTGSNAAETVDISANGGRAILFRDVANVTMDLDDVEQLRFTALAGSDTIVVGDLAGTDLTRIELVLTGPGGGGDAQLDRVTANASTGADVFGVTLSGAELRVFGLAAETRVIDAEATDSLILDGLGGDDVIDASSLDPGLVGLGLNGGLGADIILGSQGGDLVSGGDGGDTALMGAGDDVFVWNPGDDNDTIEGQAGADSLLFNGANAAEGITISANGGRVLFFRDIANVTMDLNDTEVIAYNALGGADAITVNDLAGTDVTELRIDLAAFGGGGDGAVDTVTINATAGDDVVVLSNGAAGIVVSGLAASILITGFEATDQIVINTFGGDDVVDGSALDASVAFTAAGGDGHDVLIGGEAGDVLYGGLGDDVLLGNGGLDVLDGGAGSNVTIQ